MRAVILENEDRFKEGFFIFVIKQAMNESEFAKIKKDFSFAFKKLGLV